MYVFFNSRDELQRIEVSKIVYFEAEGNYTTIVMVNKLRASVCMNLGEMERMLASQLGDEARQFFRMGMTAMYFNGSWEVSSLSDVNASPDAENIGAFVVPKINPEYNGVTLGSVDTSFAVTANCKNVDAAVEFLKYWTNEENATMLAYDYGRFPCTNWTLDESKLTPLLAETAALMTEQTNMTPWYDRVDADLGNEFNNQAVAIANGDDPQACFDALQAYAETRAQ